jgi:hypothetical protein
MAPDEGTPRRNGAYWSKGNRFLPTLFRLLFIIAVIGGLIYGGMIALVTYVHVQPREIIQTVPPSKLEK